MKGFKFATGLAALAAGAFFASGIAVAQEKVSIRLAWVKSAANAGPYYYAVEKGLYAAEGLDVTVLEGKGSPLSIQAVASGDVLVGSADLGVVAKGVEKGIPVRAVYGELQENAMAVISRASNPIRTPKDLEGKTILGSAASSYTRLLPALCREAKVDCTKVGVKNVPAPFEPLFLSGQGDGMLGLFTNVPKLESQGARVAVLRYSDYGITSMANGLIVSNETIQKRPETVRKFMRATQRAWEAMRDRPDEVVAVWLKVMQSQEREMFTKVAHNVISIMQTPNSKGKPLGWMSPKDWERMVASMKEIGELERVLPAERYFTNQFVE